MFQALHATLRLKFLAPKVQAEACKSFEPQNRETQTTNEE
jgi:hypothetical protein